MITSPANAKIKYARSLSLKKNRAAFRQFAAEGIRVIEEGERAGKKPALVFFEPDLVAANERARILLERLRARTSEVYGVTPPVLRALAQTENPQGIVAVYPFPDLTLPQHIRFILLLDAIRDPGNMGTILRTAWAAGVDAVLLSPGAAEPFNPKITRSGMGAHFFLPIFSQSWKEISETLARIPRVYLADARGELSFRFADWSPPCALILGGETEGPSPEARRSATARLAIPMPGDADSLNVAVAAGILLFEAARGQASQ